MGGYRACLRCGEEFFSSSYAQEYCSKECRKNVPVIKMDKNETRKRTTKGAMSELFAANYLFARGWEVFRALDPAASCDLIALRDEKCVRVQVKTIIYKNGTFGKPSFKHEFGRFDIVMLVSIEGHIECRNVDGRLWDAGDIVIS